MKTGKRMVLSEWSLHVPVCSTGVRYELDCCIERPINWQGWQNIELAQVITSACFLSAWQKLCNALLILARNRNRQHDS